MKLFKDFGVTAWICTLIITGSFILIGVGVGCKAISWEILLPMLGSWVGGALTAIGVLKGIKSGQNGGQSEGTK